MGVSKLTNGIRKILPLKYCGVVIVAAGNASRMKGIDKALAELCAEPVLAHTVRAFQECPVIKEIVVVTREDLLPAVAELCKDFSKVTAVIVGGADRSASVQNGLNALSRKVRLAAIHDGARPLISQEVIDRTVRAAHTYGAAAPAVPVKDTVKRVQGGLVAETPDRSSLRAVQTPQVFDIDLLKGALEKAQAEGAPITDDCSAVERLGMSVFLTEGDESNIKVTTPLDLKIAAALMEEMK